MIDRSLRFSTFVFLFGSCLALASCATKDDAGYDRVSYLAPAAAFMGNAERASKKASSSEDDGRKRILRANQIVEVSDVVASVRKVEERVNAGKGHVESSSTRSEDDSYASLTMRIPATEIHSILDECAALGNEVSRRVTSEDTTDAYLDLEARLKNTEALRKRLHALLDSAKTVEEILKVEKELVRVQSQLDTMKAKFQLMQSQVQMAKIDLTIRTKEIPGPVGAVGKGLWWTIRKLFVLK